MEEKSYVFDFTIMGTIKIKAENEARARELFNKLNGVELCQPSPGATVDNVVDIIMDDVHPDDDMD